MTTPPELTPEGFAIPAGITAWVDARVAAAITQAVPALTNALGTWLLTNEKALTDPLWLEATAWANGWVTQVEATLPDIIKQGLKGFHIFEKAPTDETETP
jgi:hypothetical protein